MERVSREEQRKASRDRARQNYEDRNSGGSTGKRVIDLSKIGGYKQDLFYRPKEGTCHIDILQYAVKTDKHPQKMKPGYLDYLLDLWVHRYVGPSKGTYLCLTKMFGKACPICEEREEMRKDPNCSEKIIKSMYPKRRCWYNVINLDAPARERKVQIFEESHFLFEKEVLEEAGVNKDEFVTFWDLEEGKTIRFRAQMQKSKEGEYFEYKSIGFEDRKPYSDKMLDETFSFDEMLIIPTYEEVRNAQNGTSIEDDGPAHNEPKSHDNKKDDHDKRESRHNEREGRRSKQEETKKETCPYDHEFGRDNDEFRDCVKCEIFDACGDELDRLSSR